MQVLHAVFFNYLISGQAKDSVFFPYFDECFEGSVEMMLFVTGRYLGSYPCLPIWNYREEEADSIDTFIVKIP